MVLPLQALVQVCFFFNPIVWMAVSRINLLRECACDTLVLEKKVLPSQTYASAVIRALKHTIDPVPTMSVGAALGHRTAKFKYRIEHMKGEHTMSRLAGTLRFLFLLLLAVTVLPMAQPPGQVVSPGDTSPASPGGLVLTNPLSLMKVTLGFGPARHPYTGEMWHHQGIDLAAKKQTEVHAGAAGRVIEAVNEYTINKGAGRYVTLQHENGYSTRYTHLHTLAVKQGDLVKAGEIIGTVGTTGLSTGPHLHFEVWFHDKPVDPAPYLQHSN
jgi:murein DD-endopeptidase MepM/ murein hydrolase activator NlpD